MRRLTPDRLQDNDAPRTLGATPRANVPAAPAIDPDLAAQRAAAELAAAKSAAREDGKHEGLRDAEREIAARVEQIEKQLRQQHQAALGELEGERQRLRKLGEGLGTALKVHATASETLAVEVAYAATTRLLGRMAADRTLMMELCRAVVRDYGHPPATLRVNDGDIALLDVAALEIPVEADRRLAPGQCVIDTVRGQFESGLDVRLEALRQALLAGLRGTP